MRLQANVLTGIGSFLQLRAGKPRAEILNAYFREDQAEGHRHDDHEGRRPIGDHSKE
jgi:hypothetical protein